VKILLVQPAPPPDYVGFRRTALPEPLALECIGQVARPHHDVCLLDLRLEAGLEDVLAAFQPDLVAVTCLTTEVYNAQDLLRQVKAGRPQVFTVVGGLHASLVPEDFQHPYVDAIVIGEGEVTFRELLETLDRTWPDRPGEALAAVDGLAWRREGNAWTFNKDRALIASLNNLPMPAATCRPGTPTSISSFSTSRTAASPPAAGARSGATSARSGSSITSGAAICRPSGSSTNSRR